METLDDSFLDKFKKAYEDAMRKQRTKVPAKPKPKPKPKGGR